MNGQVVGDWSLERRGQHRFVYAPSWLDHPLRRPISLSLPLRTRAYSGREVAEFFAALLPACGQVRGQLARCFGAESPDSMQLLAEVGRDCAGALQLLSAETSPASSGGVSGIALSATSLSKLLGLLHRAESFRNLKQGLRHCLPGTSPKAALLKRAGQWFLPDQWTATSHIVRLASASYCPWSHWLYLRMLQSFGVTTARCQLAELGEVQALVCERFDRRWCESGTRLMRLPSEDVHQALGPRSRGVHPLEEIRRVLSLLVGSSRSDDRQKLLRRLLLQAILGGPFLKLLRTSIFLEAEGRFRLAPAFHFRHSSHDEAPFSLTSWLDAGRAWRTLSLSLAVAVEIVERCEEALREVEEGLPTGFPPEVWHSNQDRVRRHVLQLQEELACQR